jgi:2-polyprenyl-6-methoxyphenol hydroxylase-like FAD-dependent oxidoreductase
MAERERRVLIAGGGIGGLTAAIALGRRGQHVTVLERYEYGEVTGAGIQLGPNATSVLRALGVLSSIEAVSFKPRAIWLFDGLSGKRLASVPLGIYAESRYRAPYLTTHRADLHVALLLACKALRTVELKPDFEISSVRQNGDHVAATAINGAEIDGSCLIGADGLWSTVRRVIASDAELSFTGATASRALLSRLELASPFDEPVVGLWLGPRAHLVHYPVCNGKELNLVAVTESGTEQQGWDQSTDPAALRSEFAGWCGEARALLEHVSSWRSWSLYSLPPLPRLSEGRVALLGDAAHPVLPYLAQGAALAIEDAAALAAAYDTHHDNPQAAFSFYAASRHRRAARVQRLSYRFGRLYHLSGLLRLVRNLILEQSKEKGLERLDWLYGFRALPD